MSTDPLHDRLWAELRPLGFTDLDEDTVAELAHASRRQRHEGTLPGYGALLMRHDAEAASGDEDRWTDFGDAERLRQLADGRTTFVDCRSAPVRLWNAGRALSERDLVGLCRQTGTRAVVLRSRDASLHVVSATTILTRRRNFWHQRPTAAAWLAALDDLPRPGSRRTLRALLDLVAHELGPAEVGATLTWLPDSDRRGCEQTLSTGGSTPLFDLHRRELDGAVRNLLQQHDGATLVSPDGNLWWVGAELDVPHDPQDRDQPGGMRHRSAARFARHRPDAWVFVVSHDGPLTVFAEGTAREVG